MRGKADSKLIACDADRITPAYAGKSLLCLRPKVEREDHPRLCGEKSPSL